MLHYGGFRFTFFSEIATSWDDFGHQNSLFILQRQFAVGTTTDLVLWSAGAKSSTIDIIHKGILLRLLDLLVLRPETPLGAQANCDIK